MNFFSRGKNKLYSLVCVLVVIWGVSHIPGIMYGTENVPLHASYIGDEQSPINGALHILEARSLLGLRNQWTVYYGPLFSILAIPPVLFDAGIKYVEGRVHTAEEYKQSILFDWGTIAGASRVVAVLFSTVLLCVLYFFFKSVRPSGSSRQALLGVLLVGANYYFFEYSHFFKHWIFIITALGVEWLCIQKIVEKKGKKWWFLYLGAVLFGAGINYFSLNSLIMWLPVIIVWFKKREWLQFAYFSRLTYSIVIGILLIILWHPIILFRYVSILGVGGENVASSLGVQNPLALSHASLVYYTTLIVLNLLPLIIALIILGVSLWREKIYSRVEVWILLLPGIVNFAFFAPAPHFEGRYMLPTVLSLIVLTAFLFGEYQKRKHSKVTTGIIYALFSFYLVFQTVHILGWIGVYSQGPQEQAMIERVLDKAKTGKSKVLLVQSYIAGHVHTKEAYEKYVQSFNKGNVNLYKEILKAPLPEGIQALDATYMHEDEYIKNPHAGDTFDQVVVMHVPRKELKELNQFDYIDENITRIWRFDDLMPTYEYVK